jgi:hypothetical protein
MVQLIMIHRLSLLLFPNVLTSPTVGPNNCAVFPPDHVWNTPIDCLPADINSDIYVNAMRPEKGLHATLWFWSETKGGPYFWILCFIAFIVL